MPALTDAASRPSRRPLVLALVFAAWTVYVWATRIRNALDDDQLHGFSLVWTWAVSLAFVAGGLAVAGLCWRTWRRSAPSFDFASRRALTLLLAATVAVWAIRVPFILADDRSAAFKVVHATLAVISVVLGFVARRSVETATLDAALAGPPVTLPR